MGILTLDYSSREAVSGLGRDMRSGSEAVAKSIEALAVAQFAAAILRARPSLDPSLAVSQATQALKQGRR